MRNQKLVISCSLLLPALLLTGACSRSSETTRGRTQETNAKHEQQTAFVRFVDAHSGPGSLYFGDTEVFAGAADKITDYKPVPAERRDFSLRKPGQTEHDALATNSEGLSEGKHYTVIAFDDHSGKASLRVVNDDESAPAEGKAKVRIINATPEHESLKLYAAGRKDELAGESRLSTASNWKDVDAVKGPLVLRGSDRNANTIRVPNMTLEAGKLYTFVVMPGQGANHRVQVTPIVDNPRS